MKKLLFLLLGAVPSLLAQPAKFQWADVIAPNAALQDMEVTSEGRNIILAMYPEHGFTGRVWTNEMVVSIRLTGEILWTADGLPTIADIHTDAEGSTYVAGSLREHIHPQRPAALPLDYFATAGFPVEGAGGAYIAKLSRDGAVDWVRQLGTSMLIVATGVAVEPSGAYYVAGVYRQTAPQFGDIVLPTPANRNEFHLFLAKFTPQGKPQWVRAAVTTGLIPFLTKVSLDPLGRGLLQGSGSTVRFYNEETSVTGSFTVYFDEAGNIVGNGESPAVSEEVHDAQGNRYVVERRDENHSNNTLILDPKKYGANGDLLWTRSAAVRHGGIASSRIYLGPQGNPILAGIWGGRSATDPGIINFGDIRLTTTSNMESYVAKYSQQGELLWAVQSEGLEPIWVGDAPSSWSDTRIQRVLFDEDGDVIVIGSLKGSVQFGDFNLLGGTSGSTSVFFARIHQAGGAGPKLSITMTSPESISIRWPLATTGYVLERAESLTESSWTTVTSPPVEIGSDHAVSVSREATAMFFRLRKQ
jgi:hypothetical protein